MADRPVSPITDDMVEAALLGAMSYDAVHDDDETPKGDDYWRGQMRAALEAAGGVAAGSTAATAGAPVSPVQATVHADLRVSGVTDDMVELGARAIADLDGGWSELDDDWQNSLRIAARAAQGVVPEPGRLPFDARDRIESTLRAYDGHTIPEIAHRIMLALNGSAGPVSPKGDNTDD